MNIKLKSRMRILRKKPEQSKIKRPKSVILNSKGSNKEYSSNLVSRRQRLFPKECSMETSSELSKWAQVLAIKKRNPLMKKSVSQNMKYHKVTAVMVFRNICLRVRFPQLPSTMTTDLSTLMLVALQHRPILAQLTLWQNVS